jgi:hypothetical protein
MVQIEQIAQAVLEQDSMLVRSLVQDFFHQNPRLAKIAKPMIDDERLLATSASLIELFAERLNQEVPPWTKTIGPLAEPFFLLKAAEQMKRLRVLCETEAPEPLRKRRLYAPPNYLEFV